MSSRRPPRKDDPSLATKPGCLCLTLEHWHWACPVCDSELAALQAPFRAGAPRPDGCGCGACGFGPSYEDEDPEDSEPAVCQGDYDDDWQRARCFLHETWHNDSVVHLMVNAPDFHGAGVPLFSDPGPRGPHAIPMNDCEFNRAMNYYSHSHNLTGGGRVAWLASDIPADIFTQLGLPKGASGVDYEVFASRLPAVLADLDELKLTVVFAVLTDKSAQSAQRPRACWRPAS